MILVEKLWYPESDRSDNDENETTHTKLLQQLGNQCQSLFFNVISQYLQKGTEKSDEHKF